MKYLMKVGDQLDLQVSYDGGAIDGVTYNAPDNFDNKVWVTASGIVEALGLGEGVVNVLSGGAIVGTIVFEVLTEAAYVAQQGIRDGSKALVVDADAVAAAPALTLIAGGTAFGTGPGSYMSDPNGPGAAFDGNAATFWQSWESNSQVLTSYIGKTFNSAVTVSKVRFKWHTVPQQMRISFALDAGLSAWVNPVNFIVPNYLDGNGNSVWQEVLIPAPAAAYGILFQVDNNLIPATTGVGQIDRLRIYEIELYH